MRSIVIASRVIAPLTIALTAITLIAIPLLQQSYTASPKQHCRFFWQPFDPVTEKVHLVVVDVHEVDHMPVPFRKHPLAISGGYMVGDDPHIIRSVDPSQYLIRVVKDDWQAGFGEGKIKAHRFEWPVLAADLEIVSGGFHSALVFAITYLPQPVSPAKVVFIMPHI